MSRLSVSLDILRYAAVHSHASKSLTALLHHTLSRDNTEALRPHAERVLAVMLTCNMTRTPVSELEGGKPLLVLSCSYPAAMSVAFDVLVDGGVFLDAPDPAGRTPLHQCVHLTQMTCLLEAGANPNIGDYCGGTPLITAVASRRYVAVERLLEYGADPLIADNHGNSALSYAQTLARHDEPRSLDMIKAHAASQRPQPAEPAP